MATINLIVLWMSLTVATSTINSHIQIYDLQNNPGLVSLQLGEGRIRMGSHKIYHMIDMSHVEPIVRRLRTIITDLKIFNINDSIILMNKKLDTIEKSYRKIVPIVRTKRGLFNGIGNMIKVITGNLDNNDLVKINTQLNTLSEQNKALVTENNEQIKINLKVQDRLNRLIKIVNDQQDVIKNNFIHFRQKFINGKNISDEIKVVKELFNLNLNIDLLANHVNNIFEAIQMSKVNTISKDILSSEELNEATKILESENINIESFDQVIEYLDLAVIHKDNKIVFIILIPLLRKDVFIHQLLEPVIKNGKMLNVQYAEALNNDLSTFLITGECKGIGQSIMCSEHHVKDVSSDTCYSKLLRGKSGSCDLIEVTEERRVKRISSNYIIITGNESTPITSNCGLSSRNISGNTLIFFRNCTVIINQTSFIDIEYTTKQQPIMIPLNGLEINSKTISTNFTLQNLQEVNLQTRQQLTFLHEQQKRSTFGISLILFTIVIISILYLSIKHSSCTPKATSQTEPGRSVLQEGAVTERPTPPSSNQNLAISNVSIIPTLPAPRAQQQTATTTTTTSTTTTTTIARPISIPRSADIARHQTPPIRPTTIATK
ncbi:uncharacterized protein LOC134283909 [Aedes albopictus]|uniref:Retrovirus-related env polyprotein from transposon n=1 Tax=Aedes albopictus TaxID=7160 RepID=A0ABM1YRI1_AEDAL